MSTGHGNSDPASARTTTRDRGLPPTLRSLLAAAIGVAPLTPLAAPAFHFPTANQALLLPEGGDQFYVGTVGKPWTSGQFGCVRTDGWQMHEGLDIRCLQRDAAGEPTDPVLATADGVVAYVNLQPAWSAYGIYIVVQHRLEGVEIYSLYAHLRHVREGLTAGQPVRAGEPIAVLGRTANTRQAISKDRAHVHFELNLLVTDRYPEWHRRRYPDGRNYHGLWNGLNFLGVDPSLLLLSQHRFPSNFNLVRFLTVRPELCRVAVRATDFPWLRRYPMLVQTNTTPPIAPVAGYELHLDFNGLPMRLFPRTAAELPGKAPFQLISVNAAEYARSPCRRLVVRRGDTWELGRNGKDLLELLTYP